ncbi:hypothetical protein N9043_01925 [bacterium]|nr:hypothetical protein [bacterium]
MKLYIFESQAIDGNIVVMAENKKIAVRKALSVGRVALFTGYVKCVDKECEILEILKNRVWQKHNLQFEDYMRKLSILKRIDLKHVYTQDDGIAIFSDHIDRF